MKKGVIMSVGILIFMLTFGGLTYGENAADSSQGMKQGASPTAGQAIGQSMQKVSVNTASAQELLSVPGMDRNLAQNIIDYRMANGPFSSLDDLSSVQGFDKQKLDSLRKYLQVKLDLNTTTANQLQRVPGIDQSLAQNIIQYREANGPFASVDDLNRIRGVDNYKLDMIKKYVQVGGRE